VSEALTILANRTDAYGAYRNRKGITVKDPLTEEIIARHIAGSISIGLHTTCPTTQTCKWLVFDLDAHGGDRTKKDAEKDALALFHELWLRGVPCVLEDSVGGFHLWIIWASPVDAAQLAPWGKQVLAELSIEGEVFPKQGSVKRKGGYGNWLRLPGKHHRLAGWSRYWIDGKWVSFHDVGLQPLLTAPRAPLSVLEPPEGTELLFDFKASTGHQAAPAVPATVPYGERNNILASLAGTMRRRGASEEAIYAALLVENKDRCQPPLGEDEVAAVAKSIASYPAGEAVDAPVPGPVAPSSEDERAEALATVNKTLANRHDRKFEITKFTRRGYYESVFEMEIDGEKTVVLGTAKDLRSFDACKAAFIDGANVVLVKSLRGEWDSLVQLLLDSALVIEMETEQEITEAWLEAAIQADPVLTIIDAEGVATIRRRPDGVFFWMRDELYARPDALHTQLRVRGVMIDFKSLTQRLGRLGFEKARPGCRDADGKAVQVRAYRAPVEWEEIARTQGGSNREGKIAGAIRRSVDADRDDATPF
jgi:hypothetical protein